MADAIAFANRRRKVAKTPQGQQACGVLREM